MCIPVDSSSVLPDFHDRSAGHSSRRPRASTASAQSSQSRKWCLCDHRGRNLVFGRRARRELDRASKVINYSDSYTQLPNFSVLDLLDSLLRPKIGEICRILRRQSDSDNDSAQNIHTRSCELCAYSGIGLCSRGIPRGSRVGSVLHHLLFTRRLAEHCGNYMFVFSMTRIVKNDGRQSKDSCLLTKIVRRYIMKVTRRSVLQLGGTALALPFTGCSSDADTGSTEAHLLSKTSTVSGIFSEFRLSVDRLSSPRKRERQVLFLQYRTD